MTLIHKTAAEKLAIENALSAINLKLTDKMWAPCDEEYDVWNSEELFAETSKEQTWPTGQTIEAAVVGHIAAMRNIGHTISGCETVADVYDAIEDEILGYPGLAEDRAV